MKGKFSVGFFKAMAVVSALAIGGGFVSWRVVEAKKAEHRESVERAKAEENEKEEEMMVGSKSPGGSLVTREQIDEILRTREDSSGGIPGIPEDPGDVTNVVPMLPGSKSIAMPLFTKRQIKEQLENDDGATEEEANPPDKKEKFPKLLPGSKSSFVSPPDLEQPE